MIDALPIAFQTIHWSVIEKIIYPGQTSHACWQTIQLPGLRIRLVEYAPGYQADHWCSKGHIVHCLQGSFENELESGEKSTLSAGSTYVVSDQMSRHRSSTTNGATLFIIDGDFLKNESPENAGHLS